MDSSRVIPQRGSDVFYADARRLQGRKGVLEFRFVARQLFHLLLRRAQRGCRRSAALVEQIKGVHSGVVDLFGVGQNALFRLQALVLAALQPGFFDFALLENPEIHQAQAVLLSALQFVDARPALLPRGIAGGDRPQLACRKRIQQLQSSGPVERQDGIVLRVDDRQVRSQQPQDRYGGRPVVDEHPPLAAGRNLPPQDQRTVFRFVQTIVLQNLSQTLAVQAVFLENRGHNGPVGSAADYLCGSFLAQQKRQGIDENGFSGTCFTCQQVQPMPELDCQIVDYRVVFKAYFSEHGPSYEPEFCEE